MYTKNTNKREQAARAYGRRDVAVFPCIAKRPLTKNGLKDATTDEKQIRQWWRRWPDANIAAPTGEVMDAFVLDVDVEKGGLERLRDLEAEHGKLPETARVRTGGGGLHFYFRMPAGEDIRNSTGKLGPGLDIRGTGGYVLLPPSVTEATYEWATTSEIADAPEWLIKALRRNCTRGQNSGTNATEDRRAAITPDVIGSGSRNDTLARIAGALRRRGAEREEIEAELARINRERCDPPLPVEEVESIAASISRYPKGSRIGETVPEVADALAELERILWSRSWAGMGGKSERDVYVELIKTARRYGTLVEDGVRVSIGLRPLALAAALSKTSTIKTLRRLKRRELIRIDNANRKDDEAGAYVLVLDPEPERGNLYHSAILNSSNRHGKGGGKPFRASLSAPRLRWSGPHPEDRESRIRRLGKACGAVVDALEAAGGSASVAELAETLNVKRPRDLTRTTPGRLGAVARLVERDIVTVSGETVALVEEWSEALNVERERSYEIAAYRRDVRRYDEEREGYRNRHRNRPDRSPSSEEMRSARAARCEKRRKRARAVLSDPSTRPGAVYRTDLHGDDVAVLAAAMAAHEREVEAWRQWREPVKAALEDLDGAVVGVVA